MVIDTIVVRPPSLSFKLNLGGCRGNATRGVQPRVEAAATELKEALLQHYVVNELFEFDAYTVPPSTWWSGKSDPLHSRTLS